MRGGVAVWMGGAMLLASVAVASARNEHELSGDELRTEMERNRALRAYVARNGQPDLAEVHFLADAPPWDDHEVTLYYLDSRKEIGFARAWILGRPEVQIQRYERPLTDQQVAAITSRARRAPATSPSPSSGLGPAERADQSAQRAEDAAGRVEAAADSAEHAADRAEAIASKTESEFHRSLHK